MQKEREKGGPEAEKLQDASEIYRRRAERLEGRSRGSVTVLVPIKLDPVLEENVFEIENKDVEFGGKGSSPR